MINPYTENDLTESSITAWIQEALNNRGIGVQENENLGGLYATVRPSTPHALSIYRYTPSSPSGRVLVGGVPVCALSYRLLAEHGISVTASNGTK